MTAPLRVPLRALDPDLPLPAYAYAGDAGVDLRSTRDDVLQPFERRLVPCGVALALPRGYAGFVLPRSGLAAKHGVSLVNAPGLIDSDYRGLGLARRALSMLKVYCAANQLDHIWLTVNKNNANSIAAYYRMGFEKECDLVSDIGGGYVMDDYKMSLAV